MDDPLLFFRPEFVVTVVEFADDGDHVSVDTTDQKRILASQAGSEGSTIESMDLETQREELEETQVIKDSVAAARALRSELELDLGRLSPRLGRNSVACRKQRAPLSTAARPWSRDLGD